MQKWYSPNNVYNSFLAKKFISYVNEFVLIDSNSFSLEELSAQRSEPSAKEVEKLKIKEKLRIKSKYTTYRYFKYQLCEFKVWSTEMFASGES